MKGSRMSLPTQMAIGMVLGIAAGALTPAMGLDPSWYKPVGQLFINLVRMVVVPLVLTTLVAGAASVGDVSKLGRVAGKTLAYYLVTTAVAVVIGLVLANIFQPGSGLSISTEGLKAKDVAPPTLVDVFLNIVPINPIEALSKGNMLQIIFFALLFGFGLSVIGDKGKQVLHFFDGAADVMIKVTGFVMLYAPIGVFGLMAYTVSMHGLSVLLPLIKLVLVMYLACILQILIVYLPCVKITGLTPSRFLKGLASPMMIAFTTCSSAAALSTTLLSVQKLGASRSVSSFSIPLGNTINMDGAAIYMGIAAIFAAEVYGIPMPLDRQLTVILLAVLASIGSMGVPGAALIMITMVFTQVGIPLEAKPSLSSPASTASWTWPAPPSTCLATPRAPCLFQSWKAISTPNAANGSLRPNNPPGNLPGRRTPRKIPFRGGNRRQPCDRMNGSASSAASGPMLGLL